MDHAWDWDHGHNRYRIKEPRRAPEKELRRAPNEPLLPDKTLDEPYNPNKSSKLDKSKERGSQRQSLDFSNLNIAN